MENKLNHTECPAIETMALIGGRWKGTILHVLSKGARRFGEINVRIPAISRKVLTEQLRELETDGLVSRKQYKELPPRVEYTLTAFGKSLCPLLSYMAAWKRNVEDPPVEDNTQLPD